MQNLQEVKEDFQSKIINSLNLKDLEDIRLSFLGKEGLVKNLMKNIKDLTIEEKKKFGSEVNQFKNYITSQIQTKKEVFELKELNDRLKNEKIDVTLPVRKFNKGKIHPISKVISEIEEIFINLGFNVTDGPEIEDDFHNFTALNIPKNHPARQMQDTFYLDQEDADHDKLLLRTHTSSVQIRKLQDSKPPLSVISIGKVYRRDSDQTHTPMFHQMEALMIDKNVNMGHLKWVLEEFLKKFFEIDKISMRFRPSFFPFTEPSAELDIGYEKKNNLISIGGSNKFLEILGCGMIHPNVLKNVNIDPEEYQGFAFGVGVERLAMLKYGITDLRSFFDSDIRFLKHFGF
jgi:phenylalanyl-tRNA synthetase alpha chain|tara:strand:+ start:5742 stop:6779 length:1038 start_codon:yes stop_codon:yes gene_type:complete